MKNIDRKLLEILANKPEIIVDFPEWMLSRDTIDEIRSGEHAVIAEIAGRDSIAAVIRACEIRKIKAVVPTLAYTGTEYGSWEVPLQNIEILKKRLQDASVKVYKTVVLGSPRFWWTLCGRNTAKNFRNFGFHIPCIGCHLYFHAIRIPIAKKLNCEVIIGGERELHNGKVKINQIRIALDSYVRLTKKFDIELFLPLRHVYSGKEVESLIGMHWDEGDQQLECVLSKNYLENDGSVSIDEKAIGRFFKRFALKTSEEFVRRYLEE